MLLMFMFLPFFALIRNSKCHLHLNSYVCHIFLYSSDSDAITIFHNIPCLRRCRSSKKTRGSMAVLAGPSLAWARPQPPDAVKLLPRIPRIPRVPRPATLKPLRARGGGEGSVGCWAERQGHGGIRGRNSRRDWSSLVISQLILMDFDGFWKFMWKPIDVDLMSLSRHMT